MVIRKIYKINCNFIDYQWKIRKQKETVSLTVENMNRNVFNTYMQDLYIENYKMLLW